MRILPFGAHALLVELDGGAGAVQRAWAAIRDQRRPGVEDVVAGARTVLVRVAPEGPPPSRLAPELADLLAELSDRRSIGEGVASASPGSLPSPRSAPTLRIPVVYDGPDLGEVARLTGLSTQEVARRHAAGRYTAEFLGFSPGFAYLSGLDPALQVPRRAEPRPSVPAGSVGVAGAMTAVYPSPTPGGWRLIGRTDARLFDPARRPPSLLEPGQRVAFRAVEHLDGGTGGAWRAGDRAAAVEPDRPSRDRYPALEVLVAGPLSTVQDGGRRGWAHVGVPRAGPVDPRSLARANLLVGNPAEAAAIELTAAGPTLRVLAPVVLAASGAWAELTLDGRPVPHGRAFPAGPGAVLEVGPFTRGLRAYLAVAGGVAGAPVLGSLSTDTLSGLGPAVLAPGAVLAAGYSHATVAPASSRGAPLQALPDPAGVTVLDLHPGPHPEVLGQQGLGALTRQVWVVSPVGDRIGVRLEGAPLDLDDAASLGSEGMVAGAVQLPGGGAPIVLMANHATTGGYPVPAVLSDAALALLAQCRPGSRIWFRPGPGASAPSTW